MKSLIKPLIFALLLSGVFVVAFRWEEFRVVGPEMLNPFAESLPVIEEMGGDFALQNTEGKETRIADFAPKTALLTFGYTFCPDVCPLVLTDMVEVYGRLEPKEREKVQMIFITLDPERDSADQIQKYLEFFHPSIVGLRGSEEEIREVALAFKVAYFVDREAGNDYYTIGHGYHVYLVDGQSRVRGFVNSRENLSGLEKDLRSLLSES